MAPVASVRKRAIGAACKGKGVGKGKGTKGKGTKGKGTKLVTEGKGTKGEGKGECAAPGATPSRSGKRKLGVGSNCAGHGVGGPQCNALCELSQCIWQAACQLACRPSKI